MLPIAVGLILIVFPLFGVKSNVGYASFGIGILVFGFGLLAYIR